MMKFILPCLLPLINATVSKAQLTVLDSMLRAHIQVLAHDSLEGRLTGSVGAEKAARYIAVQMEKIGLQKLPGEPEYQIEWEYMVDGKLNKALQVGGMIPGATKADTIIIFSAHYDHIGTYDLQKAIPFRLGEKMLKGDRIFNGANDNASGISAMLELARIYADTMPAYTLMFVAFSGEELGLLGSSNFVQRLNIPQIKQNINLEMLGRPQGKKPFITEDRSSAFRDMLNANLGLAKAKRKDKYFVQDPYAAENLFNRSDNISFYNAGIPANTIMGSSPRDKFYHSSADEYETIEFDQMTEIVQNILNALWPFVLDK